MKIKKQAEFDYFMALVLPHAVTFTINVTYSTASGNVTTDATFSGTLISAVETNDGAVVNPVRWYTFTMNQLEGPQDIPANATINTTKFILNDNEALVVGPFFSPVESTQLWLHTQSSLSGKKETNWKVVIWKIDDDYNQVPGTQQTFTYRQPPIRHAYIRNLKGKTGDDMLAFTIGDYANYNISEPGDFSNIDVAGLFCESSLCAVKMTGDGTGNFVRFRVSGIYGDTLHSVFRIWGDTNLTKTMVKNITIEDIYAIPGAAYSTVEIDDRGFGASGYSIEIDEIHIKNVYSTNLTLETVRFAGSFGSVIHNAILDGLPRSAIIAFGVNNTTTAVDNLTVKNGNIIFPDNANAAVVVNRGTITNLNIEDVVCNFVSTNNGQVARLIAGCTVTRSNWVNVYQLRGQRGWNHITSAMTGSTELNLVNYTCDGDGRIAQTTASTLTIRMSNCRRINDSGAQTAFFASGGSITLSGSIETGYNTIGSNSGGVIKTTPGVHNIPCNVDLLTSVDGASVHNLNATLSCGAGRVLVQTKVWKNLFSGATYTSTI